MPLWWHIQPSDGVVAVNEQKLLQQIAGGDEAALAALHHAYFERLVRFLYRLTADKDHIVEIVNDVFFTIWNSAEKFRGESAVSTWIMGIAYKKGLQSVSRRKVMLPLSDDDTEPLSENDNLVAERYNTQLLSQLKPHHRVVMELTYHFGFSYKEISEIVDCPENTVKTRMYHGRQQLLALLEQEDGGQMSKLDAKASLC